MIAAVFTCVFVIYLYRKLHNNPMQTKPTSSDAANGSNDFTVLAGRLAALETRLGRLADRNSSEEVRS